MNALAPAAVTGTYSDIKLVKTRSVAVVMIEIPIETASAFVAAFGIPQPGQEVHVALARLNGAPKPEPAPVASAARPAPADKRDWSELGSAQQAGMRCAEPRFWAWLSEYTQTNIMTQEACAVALRMACGVRSRAEIASDPAAFRRWEAIDAGYSDWVFQQGREVR